MLMSTSTRTQQVREAKHVVVFTGAGASAESGIPPFRDSMTGRWKRCDPAQLATREAFTADPALCWGWYDWLPPEVLQAPTTPPHRP
ncbi:NAD-dependent deacylase, partial [Pseudomonas syringae]